MILCIYNFMKGGMGSMAINDMSHVQVGNSNLFVDFRALLSESNKRIFDQFEPPMQMLCLWVRYGGYGYTSPDDSVDAVFKGKVKVGITNYMQE